MSFKFLVLTDPHFFDTDLGCSGPAYEDFMHYEQKCFAETESINNAVFKYLGETDLADTVIIVGDLTQNGEKKSHEKFIKLLYDIKAKGKKVYLITADHDWKNDPFAF
ncbi:MAG: metallophosphoesterase, partial [Clostridia bacterium]|nr:metallophosphoesterase [Clostridia bacterium]